MYNKYCAYALHDRQQEDMNVTWPYAIWQVVISGRFISGMLNMFKYYDTYKFWLSIISNLIFVWRVWSVQMSSLAYFEGTFFVLSSGSQVPNTVVICSLYNAMDPASTMNPWSAKLFLLIEWHKNDIWQYTIWKKLRHSFI